MALSAKKAITKVRRRLMDERETNFSESELLDYLSEGQFEVVQHVALTWPEYFLRSSETQLSTQNIADGTANYDLPSGFWMPIHVELTDSDGDTAESTPLSFERSRDEDANGHYYRNDDIYIIPTPDAAVTSGLNIWYVSRPSDLTVSSNLMLGDDFGYAIIAWAVMKAKIRQGEQAGEEADIWKLCEQRARMLGLRVNRGQWNNGPRGRTKQWI